MSPSAALHDPIFRGYVGLVIAVLAFAGALLTLLQFAFRVELGSVWKTYCAWLWMAPLAALFVFAGRTVFVIGVTALSFAAVREFLRAAQLLRDRWLAIAVGLGIVAFSLSAWAELRSESSLLFGLTVILVLPILQNQSRGELKRLSLGVFALFICGWLFGHLALLANSSNAYGYLCFVLFATEVTDVSAFLFGRSLGRHPLRSEISPRKTVEGTVGALLVALALPWLLRFSFPFFGAWQLFLTGLIVGVGGPLGDLVLSVCKRDLGVKDWGTSIPGHGGVLDRIDSLIFVAPLFILMTEHYYPGR